MAAVLPTQAGQTQAVSAETRVLVENLFQGTTEAAYRQLWEGCQANPTLAYDVQVARAQQDDTARARAVYTRVIERVRQTRTQLPIISLQTLDPDRLAAFSEAEALCKFFANFAREAVIAWDEIDRFPEAGQFYMTLRGDIVTQANAIARWMHEHRARLAQIERLDLRVGGYLGCNPLTSLPPQIGLFTGLKKLELFHSQLRSLPSEIGMCASLEDLNLGTNQFISIPSELSRCIGLRRLNLCKNQLTTIPATLRQCTQLSHLNVSWNQIVQSREDILQLLRPGFPDDELDIRYQRPAPAHAAQANPPAQPQGFWECIWQGIVSVFAQVSERLSHAWQSLVACLGRLIRSAN